MHKKNPLLLRLASVYKNRQLKFDFVAGIVVFLVAIPLCLGVALASGAPLFSGILSGIIGGIVVGLLSGSSVSVSGPSPGIAAIIITAITQLGDFNTFLLALTLAGLIQILIGALRIGFLVDYVPSHVVQGLLCAVGLLLIMKQIPLAFTFSSDSHTLSTLLLGTTEALNFNALDKLTDHINTGATIIAAISLFLLVFFDKTHHDFLKRIPASIIVVIMGIALNECFIMTHTFFAQENPDLVNIPEHDSFASFLSQLQTPKWSALTVHKVYLYAFIIAIVASLESLLNLKASEKLDTKRRISSKNRELLAQGSGNILAGLLGAIPITSVIVRTSVAIQSGAKTKMTTIFHGIFLLISALFIPHILNKIPLSSLAMILIYTGYKLTRPSIYKTIYYQGMDRFIPFIATVISIVFLNLLMGILIGLFISIFFILKTNSQARLDIIREVYPKGTVNRLLLPQQISFLNKASLTAELQAIPPDSQLIIDARYARYIDKEIIELLNDFKNEQAPQKRIALNFIGFQKQYNIHNYIDFIHVTTYSAQATLSPADVLTLLTEGNERFIRDTRLYRSSKIDIRYTAKTQHPIAIVLGCIDSRVPVETVFDMGFGDLFCVRVAGNVINNDVLASIEYACEVVGAKLIVVLGHTRCGAIQAACKGVKKGHITQLLAKIKPAIEAQETVQKNVASDNPFFIQKVTRLNIANTLYKIYSGSKGLKELIDKQEIAVVGCLYEVDHGKAHFSDYAQELKTLYQDETTSLVKTIQHLLTSATMPLGSQ